MIEQKKLEKIISELELDNSFKKSVSMIENIPITYKNIKENYFNKNLNFATRFSPDVIRIFGSKQQNIVTNFLGSTPILISIIYIILAIVYSNWIFVFAILPVVIGYLVTSPALDKISKKLKFISFLLMIVFLFINIEWSFIFGTFLCSYFLSNRIRKISERIIIKLSLEYEIMLTYFFSKKYLIIIDTEKNEIFRIDGCTFNEDNGKSKNKFRHKIKQERLERVRNKNKE